MLIDDPIALARRATTEIAAAHALAAIEAEVSLGERSEAWYGVADEALAHIHARWPRAHLRDAYRQPPTLSPAARRAPAHSALPARPGDQQRPSLWSWRRTATAAAVLTALGVAAWVILKHARRHPRHVIGATLIGGALVMGRPSLLAPMAALAGIDRLLRSGSTGAWGGRRGRRSSRPGIMLPRAGGVAPRTPRSPL